MELTVSIRTTRTNFINELKSRAAEIGVDENRIAKGKMEMPASAPFVWVYAEPKTSPKNERSRKRELVAELTIFVGCGRDVENNVDADDCAIELAERIENIVNEIGEQFLIRYTDNSTPTLDAVYGNFTAAQMTFEFLYTTSAQS